MSIDLQRFCANERDIRAYLQAPFELAGWVYATNGHQQVRVPAADNPGHVAYVHGKHPASAPRIVDEAFADAGEFRPLEGLPELLTCPTCLGSGLVPEHLQEGDDLDDCWECDGSGKKKEIVAVGDATYQSHYLHLLNELPDLRMAPRGLKQAALTFDGGQALLMPCRP